MGIAQPVGDLGHECLEDALTRMTGRPFPLVEMRQDQYAHADGSAA